MATDALSDITPEEDYRVPGEPGTYYCARHRKVKTRLRCGRCEKPICPKCTRMGPTGARCAECSSHRGSHMYQVKPLQFLLAFVAAFGFSLVAAQIIPSIGGFILYLLLFAPAAGTVIGKVIVRVVQGKRGLPLVVVASLGVIAGTLIWGDFLNFYLWIYIALAISAIWYWLR